MLGPHINEIFPILIQVVGRRFLLNFRGLGFFFPLKILITIWNITCFLKVYTMKLFGNHSVSSYTCCKDSEENPGRFPKCWALACCCSSWSTPEGEQSWASLTAKSSSLSLLPWCWSKSNSESLLAFLQNKNRLNVNTRLQGICTVAQHL